MEKDFTAQEQETQKQQAYIALENEILDQEIKTNITDITPVTKQYLQAVSQVKVEGNQFFLYDGRSTVCITVLSDEIIRVRMAPQNIFLVDFSYALSPDEYKISKIEVFEDETVYRISTNTVNCTVTKATFHISFSDRDYRVINEDEYAMHWEENTDFGGYYVYCTKKATDQESFYGLGDKPTEFNVRGKRFTLWGTDTYAFTKDQDPLYRNIPFYIGLRDGISYGLFFDNTFKSYFDFGCQEPNQVSFWADGGELNYYYIHGPSMVDVVTRYSSLTGRHPMPPLWAFGYHQCRWSYFPEKKVKEIASTFREKKIPCDAIYLDIDYMDGYRCFTWNKKYFPDPKNMIRDLKADGFQTVVIIDPGIKVDENYYVYKEAKEKNYFCRRCDDYFMEGHVWPGRCQFPDFTNPEVRDWWGDLFKEYVELGVAGIWNDMNEPAVFGLGTFPNDVRHNYDGKRGSHRKAHNIYGMQMVRATFEGLKKLQGGKRPFTITRSGYSGVQRFSSVWTGDNVASWEHLRLAGTMCQRLSISGISFCGTDIGGFTGEPDGELFTRWVQLGVFAPLMRAHSAGDTSEREPWSFGPVYEAICKQYIELRYRLLPYFYSAFWEHSRYGLPILRPLVMHEQDNLENHFRQDEFTYGDKILVFPVFEPACQAVNVYLPKGNWYYYWDNKALVGGQSVVVDTPLDILPIFVKAGAVVPEYPVMQYVQEKEIHELLLNIYFSDYAVDSLLYEDQGDYYGYEHSNYLERRFLVSGGSLVLSISQLMDGSYVPRYETFRVRLIGLPFQVAKLTVDSREVTALRGHEPGQIEFTCDKNFRHIEILA